MKEAVITERLLELSEELNNHPAFGQKKDNATSASDGVYTSHPTGRTATLNEAFDQLQLHLKYLLFDLEATRRENRYLRQMLENRYRPDKGDDK
ncbi:MAG: transcriptional regulator [Phycisphaerae bacterium]